MNQYIQKPLIFKAFQSKEDDVIETLEGPEQVHCGDWVVTGVKGERWPVSDAVFRTKYEVVSVEFGTFKKLPVIVYAEKLSRDTSVQTERGLQKGRKGDWIVNEVDSNAKYICASDIFEMSYELLERK